MNQGEKLSLYELNCVVRCALKNSMPDRYWVMAEISDVKENFSGHCYVEFIEKENRRGSIIAKARGTIWANKWRTLKNDFEKQTHQEFVAGIKVLVEVSVEFHELYGFSLLVNDIDPSYTLGDMAKQRAEILRKLEEEGVKDLNKELTLAEVPNKIAIISSATAAGFGDFMNQIENNVSGYKFYTKLFPAVMQGSQTEASIIDALNRIYSYEDFFDVVVIIRGGGATSDLNSFDSYQLALNCAQFPIPIITGIGHERDETVLDSIAHTRVKTPTAAAEFLISKMDEADFKIEELKNIIVDNVRVRLERNKLRISSIRDMIPYIVNEKINKERSRTQLINTKINNLVASKVSEQKNLVHKIGVLIPQIVSSKVNKQKIGIDVIEEKIKRYVPEIVAKQNIKLSMLEKIIELASPENILKKGYSLTLKNNRAVKSAKELKRGDRVITLLGEGEIESVVCDIKYENK
ncbi:MAG: exodeoxyribonuclease VII large subunit [Bacteroidales bacterium]|nr:exodeoxyribonuclease VII large subunit [Bacteroidales bacterium]